MGFVMTDNEKNLFEVIHELEKRIEILEKVVENDHHALETFAMNLRYASMVMSGCIDD